MRSPCYGLFVQGAAHSVIVCVRGALVLDNIRHTRVNNNKMRLKNLITYSSVPTETAQQMAPESMQMNRAPANHG